MAKKSKQKQAISRTTQGELARNEQAERAAQQSQSLALESESQQHFSVASQGDKTSQNPFQPKELTSEVRFAQNIALLELLDQRPQSFANESQHGSRDQNGERRVLSMHQERELATNLAFLAGVSDSPNHIMGICIEELPDIGGCQVMVAINKRHPSNGAGTLEKVQKGFEQIFRRLRELSVESSKQTGADIEEAVFNEIIALCHKRILGRLRSRHSAASSKARRRNKRFIGIVLRQFLDLPWQTRASKSSVPTIEMHHLDEHRSVLKRLLTQLDDLEAGHVVRHDDLLSLVRSFSLAFESVPIKVLLSCLKENEMNAELRAWFFSCFSKIRRYHEIASLLCHRAWRISMLRNARVQVVSNVVALEGTSASRKSIMNIWEFLARFQYKDEPIQMGTLPEWLRSIAQSSVESYSRNVHSILNEAKVHAEIQLLAYCESEHAKGILPRILASSKNACALCNAFIAIHGKYSVPKSHGKLYRAWTLPAGLQNGPLQDRLNVALEGQILQTLGRLMKLTKRPLTEFDNESSIFSFNLSESTVTECLAPATLRHHSVGATGVNGELDAESGSQGHVTESAHTVHTASGETEDGDDESNTEDENFCGSEQTEDQASTPIPINSKPTEGSITSFARQPADGILKHGQKILFSPGLDVKTRFRSRRMEFIIDEASSRFSFELLNPVEAEAVLGDDKMPVTDVRNMASGIGVLLSKCVNGEVYISHREEVIRVCAR